VEALKVVCCSFAFSKNFEDHHREDFLLRFDLFRVLLVSFLILRIGGLRVEFGGGVIIKVPQRTFNIALDLRNYRFRIGIRWVAIVVVDVKFGCV